MLLIRCRENHPLPYRVLDGLAEERPWWDTDAVYPTTVPPYLRNPPGDETLKRRLEKEVTQLQEERWRSPFSGASDRFSQTFADLQRHVSDKPIADHHTSLAGINIATFDVSDEVEGT
jgi:hypothetical protein